MIVLGIETSCDETAAAVVEGGKKIWSSEVASQIQFHHAYGGVVPELASRKHMEVISLVVESALKKAGVGVSEIDAIAVTRGPGLIGALLVGFNFAKGLAYGLGVPFVGIDHLEAHMNAIFLEPDPPPFPFTGLLVSGGHTGIYYVTSHTSMELMGRTRDDAAGEAFDKVAKMLGLGYPGGVVLSEMSLRGDPGKVCFPRPFLDKEGFDFSFSGLKTAVRRYIETHPGAAETQVSDIAAGFQEAVTDVLCHKIITAAKQKHCTHLVLAGGVAANQRLRRRVLEEALKNGIRACLPSPVYCGDNAAMIAVSGYHRLLAGERFEFTDDVYSRAQYGS